MTSCLLVFSSYGRKSNDWVSVKADAFTIISNAQANRINSLWEDLHYFEIVVEKAFPEFATDKKARKHLIVLPRTAQDYNYLAPMQTRGKRGQTAGVYLANEFNPIILVKNDPNQAANRRIIFHEYSHRLTHAILGRLPTWADEGIAELFASFRLHRRNLIAGYIGKSDIAHTISEEGFIPFETFFSADRSRLRKLKAMNVSYPVSFYAQARLLAHYAYFADNGKHWLSYLELAKRGSKQPVSESDVSFYLQMNYEELEETLRDYVHSGGKSRISIDISELNDLAEPDSIALSQGDVEAYKAMILTRGNHYKRAAEYFAKTSSTESENPIWLSGRSEYLLYQENIKKAGGLAWEANLLDTEDPFVSTLAVMHASAGFREDINSYEKDDASKLLDMLKMANAKGETSHHLFETYHSILASAGLEIDKEHSDFLYEGLNLYPDISYSSILLKIITNRIFESN